MSQNLHVSKIDKENISQKLPFFLHRMKNQGSVRN